MKRLDAVNWPLLRKWAGCLLRCFLAQVLGWMSVLHAAAQSELVLCIEEALCLQELDGDWAAASSLFAKVHETPGCPDDLLVEALARDLLCHIQLKRDAQAIHLFHRLQQAGDANKDWIAWAMERVPESFLLRPVLWRNGEVWRHDWMQSEGMGARRHHWIHFEQLAESGDWKVEMNATGSDFRRLELLLDAESLMVRQSRSWSGQWQAWERLLLSSSTLIEVEDEVLDDASLFGHWLRHYPLQLGYHARPSLFSAVEGGALSAEIDVRALELSDTLSGRLPAFRVHLNREGFEGSFWIGEGEEAGIFEARVGSWKCRPLRLNQGRVERDGGVEVVIADQAFRLPEGWRMLFFPDEGNGPSTPLGMVLSPDRRQRIWLLVIPMQPGGGAGEVLATRFRKWGFPVVPVVGELSEGDTHWRKGPTAMLAQGDRLSSAYRESGDRIWLWVGVDSAQGVDGERASAMADFLKDFVPLGEGARGAP
jgi:hypothetical protein